MAEVVLCPLVNMVIETLMSELIKEVRMVWQVDDDLKTLSKTLKKIQCVLTDAEEVQITKATVKDWLSDLKDIAYDADDVLDELQYEAFRQSDEGDQTDKGQGKQVHNFFLSCFCFRPNPILSRLDMVEKIKSINERLATVSSDTKKFRFGKDDGVRRVIKPERERPPTSSVPAENEYEFLGRDDDKKEIVELLLSDDVTGHGKRAYSVISIVGMGGLGKTTLAQHIYNDEGVKMHFEVRAWACVSENFDILKITKDILESIKKKCDSSSIDPLQRDLVEILEAKRFLIVLDDVWNENHGDWDRLRGPFNVGARGSKILVTTRHQGVSEAVYADHCHPIESLAHHDCVKLLLQHAFPGERHYAHSKLMEIGKKLVERHCQGLPLAAKVLGRLLYEKKDLNFWESILNSQLWISEVYENKVGEVMKALRVSYHHLAPDIKQCFAFCSIFPKDYLFYKDELVRLWMAQGFIKLVESMSFEERGGQFFDHLLGRAFFQRSVENKRSYKMHDCIHDLAMSVSSGECLRMEHYARNPNPANRLRHLSLLEADTYGRGEELGAFNQCKGLRTIRCVGKYSFESAAPEMTCQQAINHLIGNFKYLRVLILKNSKIDELPNSISNLKHLRYLDISHAWIKELTKSTSCLYHLQTLCMNRCEKLCSLPEDIEKLKNLRCLSLFLTKIKQLPESVSGLSNLETLDLSCCSSLCSLPEKIGELKNLRCFDLSKTGIQQLPESVSGLHSLETLDLSHCRDLCLLPENIGELKNLRGLHLSQTMIEQLPESVSGLYSLKTLDLRGCWYLYLLPKKIGELKNLCHFDLFGTDIKQLPESVSGLHNLESLDLGCCWNLCLLPEKTGELKNLHHLNLSKTKIEQLPELVSGLYSLETLDLSGCENLCSLSEKIRELKNLRCLDLSWTKIEELPESMSGLYSLETLDLSHCCNLGSLPENIGELKNLHGLYLSWTNIKQLPESVGGLHSLETLNLTGCDNLCSLPEKIVELKNLRGLELSWTKIKQLPESVSGLHSLKTLDFWHLENFWSLPSSSL